MIFDLTTRAGSSRAKGLVDIQTPVLFWSNNSTLDKSALATDERSPVIARRNNPLQYFPGMDTQHLKMKQKLPTRALFVYLVALFALAEALRERR
jgi:hypothetical protein